MTDPPIQPCHEDPLLGEQDVTEEDIRLHKQREQLHARMLYVPDPQPRALTGGLRKSAFYPPADRSSHFFGNSHSAVNFSWVRAIVWHSTETSGMPGYQGGASAPNLTCYPDVKAKKLRWYHHFRLNQSSRALVHPSGVQTNNSNVIQVEQIGTCAKGGPGMYLPEAPDWYLEGIAEFMKFMHDEWGVPLETHVRWKAYPDSYGTNNGVRLSAPSWLAYSGQLAHEHVYGNLHGDVLLAITKALAFANPGKEEDMPLNAEDKKWIADQIAANNDDLVRALLRTDLGKPGGLDTVGIALQEGLANSRHALENTNGIITRLDAKKS